MQTKWCKTWPIALILRWITGESQASKLPIALQTDQGPINDPQKIINEINSYLAKINERRIKDKRFLSVHNADDLKEFINSKKPEGVHFNIPLLKSD